MQENKIQQMINGLRILEPYATDKTLFGAENGLFCVYCLDEIDDADTISRLGELGWLANEEEPGCWEKFV